jgi:hypothetical protein
VSLDKTSLSLKTGDTATLAAAVIPDNASNQAVNWASSAPAIATVDGAGKVSAMDAGTAVITVTTEDGGRTARCTVTVTPPGSAMAPAISAQPQSAAYSQGATATALTVTASSPDNGTLSYQWYGASDTTAEGTAIADAANPSYTPPTDTLGTRYYYVAVTNTIADNGDGGEKSKSIASERARVEVNNKVNAPAPAISAQPQGASYGYGATPAALTVAASAPDGGALSYQWYSSAADSSSGGTAISGGTAAAYTPPAATAGTFYYYVVVTNTITDNGDGGTKTASVTSAVVTITVTTITSVTGVESYINSVSGGADADHPVTLPVTVNLADLSGGWTELLDAISTAGKYVDLDLSACIMSGTEFDPGTADTGKSKIVSLVLPDAAQSIKAWDSDPTFCYFTALEHVEGAGIATVGDGAFMECAALEEVSLPAVQTIGEYAFAGCTALEEVSLPVSLSSLGFAVFARCPSLTTITVDPANADYSARNGMLLDKAGTTLVAYPGAAGSVTLDSAVTAIGDGAFFSNTGLTSITLPGVKTLGVQAFSSCINLGSVSLPEAEAIGRLAFWGCTNLGSVYLPKAGTIGMYAFSLTGSSRTLEITLGGTAPTLGPYMFSSVADKAVTVKVPSGATGYGSSPTDTTTQNWGNGFRGGGWTGSALSDSSNINSNITLTIKEM